MRWLCRETAGRAKPGGSTVTLRGGVSRGTAAGLWTRLAEDDVSRNGVTYTLYQTDVADGTAQSTKISASVTINNALQCSNPV